MSKRTRARSTILDPVKVKAIAYEKYGIKTQSAFEMLLDKHFNGSSGSTPTNAWNGNRLDKSRALIVAQFLGLLHYDSLLHDVLNTEKNKNANAQDEPPQIFLCYVKEDVAYARNLYSYLVSHQYSTWFDEADILTGHIWDIEITKAIQSCQVVIVVVSKNMMLQKTICKKK